MAKTGDVEFNYNANTTTTYQYMLALNDNGRKAWAVQQLFTQPPSLIKNQIDLTVLAAPKVRLADATSNSATQDIANVETQLRTLINSTSEIKLNGYNNIVYNVLFDKVGSQIESVFDETGRIANYRIQLRCYDRWQ
jgi:hypothetical protein